MGKAAKPRALKDCAHELPVMYYNTKMLGSLVPFFSGWFFRHSVPEVRHYQENMLRVAPEEVKALLLDNSPAHSHAERLVSADGNIRTMLLPPNTTSIIQPRETRANS